MRRYSSDPNSPDNPASPYYKSRHIYEKHVIHDGRPVYKPIQSKIEWIQSPQENMGYAEMITTFKLGKTEILGASLPGIVQKVTLQFTFTGKARTSYLMTRAFFNANQKNMKFAFQGDISNWMRNFLFTSPPLQAGMKNVTATLTSPEGNEFPGVSMTVNGKQASTDYSEAVNNTVSSDGVATLSASSSSENSTTSISLSSDEPFTIVFTFSAKEIKGDYGKTDFDGELEVEVSVTYNPIPPAAPTEQSEASSVSSRLVAGGNSSINQNKADALGNIIHGDLLAAGAVIGTSVLVIRFGATVLRAVITFGEVAFTLAGAWAAP